MDRFPRWGRIAADRNGSATIEFVIWFPVFVSIFLVAFDLSLTFYSMGRMWDAARYTARGLSTGQIGAEEARSYAEAMLPGHATYVIDVDETAPMDVTVSITSEDISPSAGFLLDFAPGALTASYVMRRELF